MGVSTSIIGTRVTLGIPGFLIHILSLSSGLKHFLQSTLTLVSADPIEQRRTLVPVPRTMRHASLFPHASAVYQDAMGADYPPPRLLIFPLHRRAYVWRHTRCQGRG